jgi:hypothetical protein
VNLEIGMQRMRLDLGKGGFDAANRTRVARLELQRCLVNSARLADGPGSLLERLTATLGVSAPWLIRARRCAICAMADIEIAV